MAGPSEPQKKEGLRCECGKLLIEKDQEMGLGVRCGRDSCRKFHPLEEINRLAAEFENQKETRRTKMGSLSEKTVIMAADNSTVLWDIEGRLLDIKVGERVTFPYMLTSSPYVVEVTDVLTNFTLEAGQAGGNLGVVRTVFIKRV